MLITFVSPHTILIMNGCCRKKVLNFCVILNHKGETIGKMVEKCLLDWGIDGILTITCNDTSSNKLAIEWLKNSTKQWKNVILEHEFLHVECSGHILNFVVHDGLEQFNDSIVRVREAVRYLRSYPSRWAKWEKCVKDENVDSNKNVCLDISNGWNSTYMMLEVAEKFEKAFQRLEDEDDGFRQYIETSNVHRNDEEDGKITMNTRDSSAEGLPETLDWARTKALLQFLEIYYGTMKKISGSCNVTSDILFHEIVTIKDTLKDIGNSMHFDLRDMSSRMFNALDKY
ncbi:Zinc finger bed domain-containing protein ricesleeper [Thalictrum thalictroides]|uniref:Zinc finger bed domain-containing protein ricesleeper n=1 Tax=Thalictrum thalictroides TaxID=46969 RepID=A0A7J6UR11_THATH|nr:Zinc finger bed domain-containing protein ricesleeper [Thalictrum thalictroides]